MFEKTNTLFDAFLTLLLFHLYCSPMHTNSTWRNPNLDRATFAKRGWDGRFSGKRFSKLITHLRIVKMFLLFHLQLRWALLCLLMPKQAYFLPHP